MGKPLVDPDRPLWQNVLGSLIAAVFIPLALVLKLVTMPFERPRRRTPEEVADVLRRAIDGSATDGEIDHFISCDIADPALNDIKNEVGLMCGPGWGSPEVVKRLADLLRQVEGMPTGSEADVR